MSKHEQQKNLARSYANRFAIPYTQALEVLRDKKLGLATLENILGQTFGDRVTLDRFRENLFAHLGLMPQASTKLPKEFFFDEVTSILKDLSLGGEFLEHRPTVPPLSATVFADAFCSIEKTRDKSLQEFRDMTVVEIYMHPRRYVDLRKFGRDILDIETFANLRHLGVVGGLWGALIISSSRVPLDRVFVCGRGFYTPNTLTPSLGSFDLKKVVVLEVAG